MKVRSDARELPINVLEEEKEVETISTFEWRHMKVHLDRFVSVPWVAAWEGILVSYVYSST